LAHQLVSRIGSGVHPHGEGSLFQSVGTPEHEIENLPPPKISHTN
jgi:hypothetical protein